MGNEPARRRKRFGGARTGCALANNLTWRLWIRKCPAWTASTLAMEIRKLPRAAMMPLIFLTPLGTRADSAPDTRISFAHSLTKPIKTRSILCCD